jgi:hypothetical protein
MESTDNAFSHRLLSNCEIIALLNRHFHRGSIALAHEQFAKQYDPENGYDLGYPIYRNYGSRVILAANKCAQVTNY